MHRHVVVSSFLSDRDGDAGLVGARENVAIVGVQSIHFLAKFRREWGALQPRRMICTRSPRMDTRTHSAIVWI